MKKRRSRKDSPNHKSIQAPKTEGGNRPDLQADGEAQPLSIPAAFEERIRQQLPEESAAFLASLQEEVRRGLRIRRGFTPPEENFVDALTPLPFGEACYAYDPALRPGRSFLHDAGLYYIQDPSAMLPAALLDARPGERLLDLCAAPGGKATQIGMAMQGEGFLLANEIHPERAHILEQNIERMGLGCAAVSNMAPEELSPYFGEFFDKILVDAPCSGEGMFRREAEAVREWSPKNVEICAARQDKILDEAVKMLRPGGRLVYSTCTFAPAEDEGSVERLLERAPGLHLLSVEETVGPEKAAALRAWGVENGKDPQGLTLRIWPHHAPGEGHFAAVLVKGSADRKKNYEPAESETSKGPVMDAADSDTNTSEKYAESSGILARIHGAQPLKDARQQALFESFLREMEEDEMDAVNDSSEAGEAEPTASAPRRDGSALRGLATSDALVLFGAELYLVPSDLHRQGLSGLRLLRPGLDLGSFVKDRFEPAHALAKALMPAELPETAVMELTEAEAQAYLRGESLRRDTDRKGYVLLCYKGLPLGFGKAAGGRINNKIPKGIRRNY